MLNSLGTLKFKMCTMLNKMLVLNVSVTVRFELTSGNKVLNVNCILMYLVTLLRGLF